MSDLDPESRRLLALARAARAPSKDDRARVARRLALVVGASAGAAASAAVVQAAGAAASVSTGAAGNVGAAAAAKVFKAGATWGASKLTVAGALLLTAAGAYLTLGHPGSSPGASLDTAADAPPRAASETVAAAPAVASEPAAKNEPSSAVQKSSVESPVRPRRSAPATLPEELELLHRAQVAWRERAAPRALDLLDQHRRQYPHSELRSEREALQVLALCEVGSAAKAKLLAIRLLKRAPSSPARAAIEESCAAK